MKKILLLSVLFGYVLALSQSDKLNALSEHFLEKLVKKEVSKLTKPPLSSTISQSEFESAEEFATRKNKALKDRLTYDKKIDTIKAKNQPAAISKALGILYGKPLISDLKYSVKNEMFFATLNFSKRDFNKTISIKIAKKLAQEFKENINSLVPEAIFYMKNKRVQLDHIEFNFANIIIKAELTDSYFKSNQIAMIIKNDYTSNLAKNSDRVAKIKGVYDDDLEKMLENSQMVKEDKSKWAFIIGIEKYEFTDNIVYSSRSAKLFEKVVHKRLGVKKSHIYSLMNEKATLSKVKTSLKRMLRNVKKGDTIYFYYNGHGVPVPELKNEPFMLASDVDLEFVQDDKFFSLQNLYTTLSNSKASKVIAFVDSCFSGATDAKAILKGVAATRVKPKSVKFNTKKMVVLTAGKGRQFSNGYNKKGHRLFSYFLMRDLINGHDSVKTLFKSTYANTKETSFEEYGDLRVQEPTIEGNFRLNL